MSLLESGEQRYIKATNNSNNKVGLATMITAHEGGREGAGVSGCSFGCEFFLPETRCDGIKMFPFFGCFFFVLKIQTQKVERKADLNRITQNMQTVSG